MSGLEASEELVGALRGLASLRSMMIVAISLNPCRSPPPRLCVFPLVTTIRGTRLSLLPYALAL
jgi:hypothetical protein